MKPAKPTQGHREGAPGWESVVATALRSRDPGRALRAASEDVTLPAALRRRLAAVDEDGVRVAALLVLKLRFERLLRGHRGASAWFAEDPAAFTAVFQRYHAEIPATSPFPQDEAVAWDAWLSSGGGRRGASPRPAPRRPGAGGEPS